MREIQTLVEIEPLTTVVDVSMEVNPVNDNPYSYVALKEDVAGNGRHTTVSRFLFIFVFLFGVAVLVWHSRAV